MGAEDGNASPGRVRSDAGDGHAVTARRVASRVDVDKRCACVLAAVGV
jgi:hypothetical protein